MAFLRYVAIGDSTTEGLEDPYPDGSGYRGWADRLAERMARRAPVSCTRTSRCAASSPARCTMSSSPRRSRSSPTSRPWSPG